MEYLKKINKKLKDGIVRDILRETAYINEFIKKFKNKIIFYTVISMISVGITMLITIKMGNIVDLLVQQNIKEIIKSGFFYVSFGLINVVNNMIIQRLSCGIDLQVRKEIRTDIYKKVMVSDWEKLKEYHSGDILSRINDDVNIVSSSVIGWVPTFIINSFKLTIAVGIMMYYDFSIVLILSLCIPIVFFGSKVYIPKIYSSNKKMREVSSKVMAFDKDSFQNIQIIKCFGVIKDFCIKMKKIQDDYIESNLEYNKYSILSGGLIYVCGQIAAIICLSWIIYHVYIGKITIGTMAIFIMLAGYVSSAFKELTNIVPKVISTISSSARLRVLMNIENEEEIETERSNDIYLKSKREGIVVEVDKASFSYYKGQQVFDRVSLIANPGEIVALVGPSGEGKTTMIRILLGLIKCKSGKVVMYNPNSKEYVDVNPSTRKMISYVPQGNTMMFGTIAENMRMINESATDEEIIDALKKACAYDFVEKLPDNINHLIGEGGGGFSEGQSQRLSIARALLSKAPILLLDEATSALDIETERKILKNIMKIDKNHTCILTTHRPSVLPMCDRVYRISNKTVSIVNEDDMIALSSEY